MSSAAIRGMSLLLATRRLPAVRRRLDGCRLPAVGRRLAVCLLPAVCLLLAAAAAPLAAEADAILCLTPEAGRVVDPDSPGSAGGAPVVRDGWPVNLSAPGSGFPYTPTLFDADGDGADEIFLTGGHTFGLRGDGTFLPGWPTVEHMYMGYGTNANKPGPSVADLEGDGDFEILWSQRDWYAGSSHMWTFNAKEFDGTNLPNFPHSAPDQSSNALDVPFVLGDTDGDGTLEAWGPHSLGNTFVHYRLTGFDHLGNLLFTTDLDPQENIVCLYFGDADGNGVEEMFAVSLFGSDYRLYLFESDGGIQDGYPIVLHTLGGYPIFGPPVPADLDDDGDLEFLIGTYSGGYSQALCIHHDGTPYDGFPIAIATSSQLFYVGLGDLTGDGEPELVATDNHLGSAYRIHAIDIATGMPLPGWPYTIAHWPHGFPAIVDVDGDGFQDVCVSTDGGQLHAIAQDGSLLPGYPKFMMAGSISGVAAGDIDGDGLFELVAATWNGWVYAWDTTGPVLPGRADWPLRGVDARNTGVYRKGLDPAAAPLVTGEPAVPLRMVPNPLFSSGQLLLGAGLEDGVIEILDASGRVVQRMETMGRTAIPWTADARLPSGTYWARLRGGEQIQHSRVVLVR